MNSGEMLARVSSDVVEIRRAVKYLYETLVMLIVDSRFTDGILNTTQLVGGLISMYGISPQLTTVMCVAVPAMVFVGSYFGKYILFFLLKSLIVRYLRYLSRLAQDARARTVSMTGEVIQNIRTGTPMVLTK